MDSAQNNSSSKVLIQFLADLSAAQSILHQQLTWAAVECAWVCWLPRMFSWPFQLACSIEHVLHEWEITALRLRGWPLPRKEEQYPTMITGILSGRFYLFVVTPQGGGPTWQTAFLVPKIRWLTYSKVNLKTFFVTEMERKKIGLSFFLISVKEKYVKDFNSDILRQLQLHMKACFCLVCLSCTTLIGPWLCLLLWKKLALSHFNFKILSGRTILLLT